MADLRFASWAQSTIGAALATTDEGGDLGPGTFQPTVTLSGPRGGDVPGPRLTMIGPGGVTGFDPGVVVRVEPPAGFRDGEETTLAAVEFAMPELPWLLTPASAGARGRVRPWIVLVVVDADDVPVQPGRPLPVIEAPSAQLPDLRDSWGWAHVQLPSPEATPPPGFEALAGQQVARLLCPRRLAPGRYRACVVPAFEGGRAAGLGMTGAATESHAPAWDLDGTDPVRLPVYHTWEFATGNTGGFKQLVRRVLPADLGTASGFGVREVDMSQPWTGSPPLSGSQQIVSVRGALQPFGDPPPDAVDDATWTAFRERLESELAAPADRLAQLDEPPARTGAISPPIYGGRHIGKDRVNQFLETPNIEWPWADWLNGHPATRIAAGLGAEYVRRNQEQLMAQAWEQAGAIREANRLRAVAELSGEVAGSAHRRHVATLTPGELVGFAAPVARRVRTSAGGPTLFMEIAVSPLADAAASSAFARFVRPAGPIAGGDPGLRDRIVGRGLRGDIAVPDPPQLLARLTMPEPMEDAGGAPAALAADAALRASVATTVAERIVTLDAVASVAAVNGFDELGTFLDDRLPTVVGAAGMEIDVARMGQITTLRAAIASDLESTLTAVDGAVDELPDAQADDGRAVTEFGVQIDEATLRERLVAALEPGDRPARRLASRLSVPARMADPGGLRPVMTHPVFPVPAALALLDADAEWFLPGIGGFPANRAALLDINGMFIESYFVGLNHELMSELRWREYPTDLRGTPFRRFWPRPGGEEDIPEIATWQDGGLGQHLTLGDDATAVLLIRGDVVRRFPDMIVTAVRAAPNAIPPQPQASPAPGDHREPLFAIRVDDATMAYAFAIDRDELEVAPTAAQTGWFLVLQEHVQRIRFGFDPPGTVDGFASWNDLTWPDEAHAGVPFERGFAVAGRDLLAKPDNPGDASWNRDSADVARIALQRPFRLLIHAHRLVGRG